MTPTTPVNRPLLGDHPGRTIEVSHGKLEYRLGPGKTCEIVNINVDPHMQRRGIGSAMLQMLLVAHRNHLATVYAFTADNNYKAHAWYRSNKFNLIPVPDFYGSRGAFLCVLKLGD